MATENKVTRVFHFLVDRYDVRVQYDPNAPKDSVPNLIVTLTVTGQVMTYMSVSTQFKQFCVELARAELGESFTSANMKTLSLQLETIIPRKEAVRKSGSCCACADSSFEMDDE